MARNIRDPRSQERIVEAAWRLVSRSGAEATTMRAIAAEAGVTTGSVTHYFEDKADVMTAVLEHNNRYSLQRITEASEGLRGLAAVRACALALMPTEAGVMSMWRVWLAFWTSGYPDPSGAWELQGGYHSWRDGMRAHLAEAVRDGEIPSGLNLRYEADRIGALVAGVGLVFGPAHLNRAGSTRTLRMLDDHLAGIAEGVHRG
nr:TetR family transcriptional regulator [Saccharopolyspora sp. HNM0983]